jgi:hypothetical protein
MLYSGKRKCALAMQMDLVAGIDHAYAEHTTPIVFALTGRTGSGCTTAAVTLGKQFPDITMQKHDHLGVEARKLAIVGKRLAKAPVSPPKQMERYA